MNVESTFKSNLVLDNMHRQFPSGLSNYCTTYQHDFLGKQGENREVVFYYTSSRSNTPDWSFKPPIGFGRPVTPVCGRPSGH